jgi:hypothetical protein
MHISDKDYYYVFEQNSMNLQPSATTFDNDTGTELDVLVLISYGQLVS